MKDRAITRTTHVRDPKGNRLHSMLLQVLERDGRGRPTSCRLMHDDETLDVAAASAGGRKVTFLLVWGPKSDVQNSKDVPSPVPPKTAEELRQVRSELSELEQRQIRLDERLRIATRLKEMSEQAPAPESYETEGERAAAQGLRDWIEQLGASILEEVVGPVKEAIDEAVGGGKS